MFTPRPPRRRRKPERLLPWLTWATGRCSRGSRRGGEPQPAARSRERERLRGPAAGDLPRAQWSGATTGVHPRQTQVGAGAKLDDGGCAGATASAIPARPRRCACCPNRSRRRRRAAGLLGVEPHRPCVTADEAAVILGWCAHVLDRSVAIMLAVRPAPSRPSGRRCRLPGLVAPEPSHGTLLIALSRRGTRSDCVGAAAAPGAFRRPGRR